MSISKKKPTVVERRRYIGHISLTEKAFFVRHLAMMLKAGVSLIEALSLSAESSPRRLQQLLSYIQRSVERGRSLSNVLSDYPKVFSALFIKTIHAGEVSGNLEQNLFHLAEQLEKERELRSKIKTALTYPSVIFIASIGLGIAVTYFILPKITPLFEGFKIKLPLSTRGLIWLSHFIQTQGVLALVVGILFVLFVSWLFRQLWIQPLTHGVLLRLPWVKRIIIQINLARFCRVFGMLLRSGLSIEEALGITQKTLGNYYFRQSLTKVLTSINRGGQLSDTLSRAGTLYPPLLTRMIRIGEEAGQLDETLLSLAGYYENEVDQMTKSIATFVEPILLLFIGLVVAFLALSIITPIYDITGSIKP